MTRLSSFTLATYLFRKDRTLIHFNSLGNEIIKTELESARESLYNSFANLHFVEIMPCLTATQTFQVLKEGPRVKKLTFGKIKKKKIITLQSEI